MSGFKKRTLVERATRYAAQYSDAILHRIAMKGWLAGARAVQKDGYNANCRANACKGCKRAKINCECGK